MNLTPEMQACINAAAAEASKQTRDELFSLLGIEDNEKGRRSLKALGSFAELWGDVGSEAKKQGVKGFIKFFYTVVKYAFYGGLAYLAWKSGLLDR